MNRIILLLMASLYALLSSCVNTKDNCDSPLRYIVDLRGPRDSLGYNKELKAGSYNVENSRLLFYVEDKKDSLFYNLSLRFEFDSYESKPIDAKFKNDIVTLVKELMRTSKLEMDSKVNGKRLRLYIQATDSENIHLGDDPYIEARYYFNEFSDISKEFERILKEIETIINS